MTSALPHPSTVELDPARQVMRAATNNLAHNARAAAIGRQGVRRSSDSRSGLPVAFAERGLQAASIGPKFAFTAA